MMSYFGAVLCFLTVFTTVFGLFHDHYPDKKVHPRPCSQPHYTPRLTGPICTIYEYDHSIVTDESHENCKKLKADECPEFNDATCVTGEQDFGGFILTVPYCVVSYNAQIKGEGMKQKPWIEIYYVNQFGTRDDMVNISIIEIARIVHPKKTGLFAEQADWPNNVLAPTGVQGLNWEVIKLPSGVNSNITSPENFCKNDKGKEECQKSVAEMFKNMFNNKQLSDYTGSTAISAECQNYIVAQNLDWKITNYNQLTTKVCRVRLSVTTELKFNGTVKFSQIVQEAQAYFDISTRQMVYRKALLGGNSINPDGSVNTY